MFQFRAFPSYTYLIQYMIHEYCPCVFPHSDISGSTLICSSPKLFAACHVLHRLLMPRHSPCALFSLTFRQTASCLIQVLLNYAGSTRSFFSKLFLPFFFKFSTICFRIYGIPPHKFPLLPCFSLFLYPVFKVLPSVHLCTLKIEQCKIQKGLTWSCVQPLRLHTFSLERR